MKELTSNIPASCVTLKKVNGNNVVFERI